MCMAPPFRSSHVFDYQLLQCGLIETECGSPHHYRDIAPSGVLGIFLGRKITALPVSDD